MANTPAPSATSWQSGFWCLMGTQFQNAFSDNALKQLIILILLANSPPSAEDGLVAIGFAVFATPFILFSMLGGWLADRFSKQRIMVDVKLAEVGIMLFATFALSQDSLLLKLGAIFLMGCHSAIFAPSKYGILPEILPHGKLSWGNGILEFLTFMGIILGTYAAGAFRDAYKGREWIAGFVLVAVAVCGWFVSRRINQTPAANPNCPRRVNPVTDLWIQLKIMKENRDIWRACAGNTGFYFVAALVTMNMLVYGKSILLLNDTENSLLNVYLGVGIGLGSVVAGIASRGRIEYKLVPVGAVGLALSSFPMGLDGITAKTFYIALASLGFFAGIFIVPITTVLQDRPSPSSKGAVQGAVSVLSFLGIFAASLVQWVSRTYLGVTSGEVFWICGACALLTGAYAAISRGRMIQGEAAAS